MKGQTDVRTYVRTLYVRTDVHDVMALKPNFLTSVGYHIFLTMVLRPRAPKARAELRYNGDFRLLEFGILNNHLKNKLDICCIKEKSLEKKKP